LWVIIPLRWGVLDITLCDKVCQWLAAGQWFSPGTPFSSTNKSYHHDITEILLKVALNTINQTKPNPYRREDKITSLQGEECHREDKITSLQGEECHREDKITSLQGEECHQAISDNCKYAGVIHGWTFSVFWLISVFLAKVQTVLEIRVTLKSFFRGWGMHFWQRNKHIWEDTDCVNSRKFSVFVQKNTFTHDYISFRGNEITNLFRRE
jgi:hypothetical protein